MLLTVKHRETHAIANKINDATIQIHGERARAALNVLANAPVTFTPIVGKASFLPKIARESGKSYGHRRINRSYRPIKTRRTGRRQLLTRSYNFPMTGRLFFDPTHRK